VELFAQYDEDSYRKCVEHIRKNNSVSKVQSRWEDVELQENDPIQYKKTFCPKFNSPVIRSLLYVLQGVEANLDLASKKLFEFRTTVQTPFVTKEYRIPGKHLMSEDQFEEYIRQYMRKILDLTEMPPIYIPKRRSNLKFAFQRDEKLFEMVDGSNLVMTDVSAEVPHEERQILVRESRTGILRDADQTERDRRIEMYYPSKHTSIQIPRYIDVDHSQIEQVMETLIEQHGEYGPIQIMETAVAYYQLDDEKYYRLRMKLNDLIISKSRFDDFYASRHFGQFIIYMLETKQISNRVFVEHLTEQRDGPTLTAELRAFLILLELWDAPENQISEMNVMERIFGDDIFESRIIEEIFPVNVPENILTALNPAISMTHDE